MTAKKPLRACAIALGSVLLVLIAVVAAKRIQESREVAAERHAQRAALQARRNAEAPRARREYYDPSTVDAVILFAIFEENPIEANKAWKGIRYRVRGRIQDIGTHIPSTPYVLFDTDDGFFLVQAMLAKHKTLRFATLATLKRGEQAAMWCVVDGKVGKFGNVIVDECSLCRPSECSW